MKFCKKGIYILSLSSFVKVLGRTSAEWEIEKVCGRNGILSLRNAELITEDNDLKIEKRRRRTPNKRQSSKASEVEEMQGKVEGLETQLSNITVKLDQLTTLMQRMAPPSS